MKVCPQCSATYEDVMFFCLEDGMPLSSTSVPAFSNPVTLENTLDLPAGENTLALPTSGEKTLDLPHNPPETIASPVLPPTVQNPAWQPGAVATQETLTPGTDKKEDKTYLPPTFGQGYSSGGSSKTILGAVLGSLVLLGTAAGMWWILQPSAKNVAVVDNVNQQTGGPGNLVFPTVNINSSNAGSNIDRGRNNSNFVNANQLNTNQSAPKSSPPRDKSPTPGSDRGDETSPETPEPKTPTPVPRTPPPVPKTVSGGVLNGKAVNLVKPPYPPAARAVKASGAVNVQVTIDEEGNVISASAVSGHPLLRAASVSAAQASKFSPTILSGQRVKVTGVIVYNFIAP
jgi:TonB family protein